MAALARAVSLYTPEEYLALERAADFKSEYLSGEIFARAGAGTEHNTIAANIQGELYIQLRGRPCRALGSDQRVAVEPGLTYTYPDVVVVCGEVQFVDDVRDTVLKPTVIVEVLSKSTEAYDRGEKFARYWRQESIQDVLLVSQESMRIEHFVRQPDSEWLLSEATAPESVVVLKSIGCELIVGRVYDKVIVPAAPNIDDHSKGDLPTEI